MFLSVTGLPYQVWQPFSEIHSVLACSGANFKHRLIIRQFFDEHLENGVAIALT
jgi:hypothetical protein